MSERTAAPPALGHHLELARLSREQTLSILEHAAGRTRAVRWAEAAASLVSELPHGHRPPDHPHPEELHEDP